MSSEKAFRRILVVRVVMILLTAAILGGLDFTSVFPNGETVSVVTPEFLKVPWVFLGVIVMVSIVKFFGFLLLTEDFDVEFMDERLSTMPLKLYYMIVLAMQGIKIMLWISILGYAVWGIFTDSINWRVLAIPVAIYLVIEVFYTITMLRSVSEEE